MTLTLTGGATVVWGQSADNELKAQVLAVLLGQEAQTYDVSSRTVPPPPDTPNSNTPAMAAGPIALSTSSEE
ncbi:hypothetical protein [Actinomyces ruminis]|uniref:hypothetical protein n=1 Tax=Actinomyces ruminis TaxID=1937003 RepID=UPI00211DFF72|nr:hypothetical protein [Actinomyces ruminis]